MVLLQNTFKQVNFIWFFSLYEAMWMNFYWRCKKIRKDAQTFIYDYITQPLQKVSKRMFCVFYGEFHF